MSSGPSARSTEAQSDGAQQMVRSIMVSQPRVRASECTQTGKQPTQRSQNAAWFFMSIFEKDRCLTKMKNGLPKEKT